VQWRAGCHLKTGAKAAPEIKFSVHLNTLQKIGNVQRNTDIINGSLSETFKKGKAVPVTGREGS
jgi:hypothetical protein